jgi:hypothetical protein
MGKFLDGILIMGSRVSTRAISRGFACFLLFLSCLHLPDLYAADNTPSSPQWSAARGITLSKVNSRDLRVSGMQPDSWVYATAALPFPRLEPGATYRLEGWMKVESVSDSEYPPMLKLVVGDRNGKYVGDWATFAYSLAKRDTWQKLWVEVKADDRFDQGHIAVDKGATNKPMKAVLYIRGVTFTKIREDVTARPYSYSFEDRFSDVFWPYKKSDVIGWVPGTLKDYKDYGVTFVSWGRFPSPDAASVAAYCKQIKDALQVGTQIGADIGFKTNFGGFIKLNNDATISAAQTKDLKGKPFVVEEMSNIRVKGYPAYWFSINNAEYRNYLKDNVERAIQCKPYGLMVDDVSGDTGLVLWAEGEYSENGVSGFRRYLQSIFTSAQLADDGISDVTTFDIREYHQDYLSVPRDRRPFRRELINFQLSSAVSALKEVKSILSSKLDRRVPIGANLSPASSHVGFFGPELDYFSFECRMKASSGIPNGGESLLAYKMADALKRPAVAMGTGTDHAFVQENHLPGMVRYWIAEAYAFGNYFMAPYELWAYSSLRGSYSYRPRNSKELAPVMQFIKSRAHLFDDYKPVARTALVLSYPSHVAGRTDFAATVKDLANQNIPFEIVIVGDDTFGFRLSENRLSGYDCLLVPAGSILTEEDSTTLANIKASGKLVVHSVDDVDKSSQLIIQGVKGIRATLRAKTNNSGSTAVLHLLNSDYNLKTDSYNYKHDFIVKVPKKLLKNPNIRQVKFIRSPSWPSDSSPDLIQHEDTDIVFQSAGSAIEIRVPFLDIWGILELT